jgi:hypothetical protein
MLGSGRQPTGTLRRGAWLAAVAACTWLGGCCSSYGVTVDVTELPSQVESFELRVMLLEDGDLAHKFEGSLDRIREFYGDGEDYRRLDNEGAVRKLSVVRVGNVWKTDPPEVGFKKALFPTRKLVCVIANYADSEETKGEKHVCTAPINESSCNFEFKMTKDLRLTAKTTNR